LITAKIVDVFQKILSVYSFFLTSNTITPDRKRKPPENIYWDIWNSFTFFPAGDTYSRRAK